MRIILTIIIAAFYCSANIIQVEGVAYNRESAINNALRTAVEQGIGMQISSETMVENYTLVSDKILTNTQGYVSSYTVTDSSRDFGLYKVKLDVKVSEGKLKNDLMAQKLLYEIKNRPRIMVLLDERVNGVEMFEKTATHMFEQELLKREFVIVEPEQLEEIKKQTKSMNNNDLADFAFRNGADLIVRGQISVAKGTPKIIYGTDFLTVPIQMNARIVRADNAQILVSKTERVKKNSREEYSAAQFGLETGAKTLAKELLESLNEYWRSEAYNDKEIEFILTGVESSDLNKTETMIKSLSFVKDIHLRYLEQKTATFDLKIAGSVQDLRFAISNKKDLKLSIKTLTANKVVASVTETKMPIQFEYEAPNIEILEFNINDIFPSRANYYTDNPLGTVSIKCNNQAVNNIKVGVRIPELMELPTEFNISNIMPNKTTDIEIKLLLDQKKLFNVNSTQTVNGQVTITFNQSGKEITRSLTTPIKIHGKNAMDWAVPNSIGGFVNYNDESIKKLSRQAIHSLPLDNTINSDLLNTMAFFETIKSLGIKYVKDPSASGSTALDMVQYPLETIKLKSGDCDDLAVLYASMLTSIGIPSAIISYHDHVLVMFDTGLYKKNRFNLSADTTRTIIHNEKVWIPIETTLLGKGFVDAWHAAASEFHTAISEGQQVYIIELQSAWNSYPPVAFKAGIDNFNLTGNKNAISIEYKHLKDDAAQSISNTIKKLQDQLSQNPKNSHKVHNQLGVLAIRSGDYESGLKHFKKAKKLSVNSIEYKNNYACALLINGQEEEAGNLFNSIYKTDKTGRAAINRALCSFVQAQDSSGIEAFVFALNEALEIMPESNLLSEYIGLDFNTNNQLRASNEHDTQKKQTVNTRRMKELIKQRVLSRHKKKKQISGTTNETSTGTSADTTPLSVMPFGGIRGADPEQVMKIIDLLIWFTE